MKVYSLNLAIVCAIFTLLTGCSSDDPILDEDSNSESVSLRNSSVLQHNNNIDNLAITTFPNSFPIPPYNYPAGYNESSIPRSDELLVTAWTNSGYEMNNKVILKFKIIVFCPG